MKAQIISENKITTTPNGDLVYVTRTNTEVIIKEDNSRVYTIITEYADYQDVPAPTFDDNGNIVTDSNGEPIVTTESKLLSLGIFHTNESFFLPEEVNALGLMLRSNLPDGLNDVEEDLYKRQHALLYKTINDVSSVNGFLGTKEWKINQRMTI